MSRVSTVSIYHIFEKMGEFPKLCMKPSLNDVGVSKNAKPSPLMEHYAAAITRVHSPKLDSPQILCLREKEKILSKPIFERK